MRQHWWWRVTVHLVDLGLLGLFALPLLWLCLGAFWPDHQPLAAFRLHLGMPQPRLLNFVTAWQIVPMGRFLLNSLLVVVLTVPLTVLVASLAAFALTQLPIRGQHFLVLCSLAALLVPYQALWLGRFPFFKALGWVDRPWPLVALALIGGSPLYVLLIYVALRRVPSELWEAARQDGATNWQLWYQLALPLTRSMLVSVALLSFLQTWGDFANPLLYLRTTLQMTLPVGLRMLAQIDPTRWPLVFAGALILVAPAVLVYLLGQRFLHVAIWLE